MSVTGARPDPGLLHIGADPKPRTIEDVIDRMSRLDAALPGTDGLKWFNWLYLLVTKSVKSNPTATGWKDPQWLRRLDVVFANFYFAAIESALSGIGTTAKSWQALFDARQKGGVYRFPFRLPGMNARTTTD